MALASDCGWQALRKSAVMAPTATIVDALCDYAESDSRRAVSLAQLELASSAAYDDGWNAAIAYMGEGYNGPDLVPNLYRERGVKCVCIVGICSEAGECCEGPDCGDRATALARAWDEGYQRAGVRRPPPPNPYRAERCANERSPE